MTVRFHADRIDARVRPAPARELEQRFRNAHFFVVQRNGIALLSRLAQALGETIDRDDALRAEQIGARDGEQSDGAASPHGDGVALPDRAVLRTHVAGRENVREKQHLLVGEVIRHLDRSDIGEWNSHVLGLAAGVATQHVRIAENACG